MELVDKYLEFHCRTRIVFQVGALSSLPSEMERLGAKRPFVVSDRVLEKTGIVGRLLDVLKGGGLPAAHVFLDVPPDSDVGVVETAARLVKESSADSLVVLGGGSVLDSAKAINIVFSKGGRLLDHQGVGVLMGGFAPMICLPTTAGTGSEVTTAAVVKDRESRQKLFFVSPYLAADTAVLDPELTASMPPRVTAATGIDALTHAVEALLAKNAQPLSDALAVLAIRAIRRYLPRAVEQGTDLEARGQMLMAAAAAGIAFSTSGVGIVHACAHACGALKNVHHGTANAILLPHGVAFNLEVLPERRRLLSEVMGVAEDRVEESLAGLVREVRLPTKLRDVGVTEGDLEALAAYAESDGSMFFNPREASREDLLALVRRAY